MAYKPKDERGAKPGPLANKCPEKLRETASFTASPARREAFAILLELERGHGHADELLRAERVTALRESDRNLATTLVMGTLRWQIALDRAIRPLLNRPNAKLDAEIGIALRLGAFQLLHLDRIPAHAAIGESVALAKAAGHKFASGMVNAVLRKIASGTRDENAPAAFPAWLVTRWQAEYGSKAAEAICRHGQQQPRLALRLGSPQAEDELAAEGVTLEPGALLTAARVVSGGDVTATAMLRDGWVRIQEEGSQLIAELADGGKRILDLCAAPGGKTLILAERNPAAKLVACESNPARMLTMGQRFDAMRQPELTGRIELIHADGTALESSEPFDLVLADVPCSGTGTLCRNPEIRHRLTLEDLGRHHERQCALLRAALRLSRRRVVYSTCSLEPEENGAAVAAVLAENQDWKQIGLAGRVQELAREGRLTPTGAAYLLDSIDSTGALRLLPGRVETDGFFVALLERVS